MHAPAAVQFTLIHFGLWRSAIAVLSALVLMSVLAWISLHHLLGAATAGSWGALVLIPLVLIAAGSLMRQAPVALCWGAQGWSLGSAADGLSSGTAGVPGRLQVSLDLGHWMLLRFCPEPSSSLPRRCRWLPVQRRGHEPQWHALRCAVYAASPSQVAAPLQRGERPHRSA
jgi:hypothetical protein